jgi:diguanylate cyclase (GGDEF)-like protein
MNRLIMDKVRDIPIQRKLMLLIMLTCGVTMFAASLLFVVREVSALRQVQREDLAALADIVGKNTAAALMFNDRKSAQETLAPLSAKANILATYVLTSDDRLFARYVSAEKGRNNLPLAALTLNAPPVAVRAALAEIRRDAGRFLFSGTYTNLIKPVILDGQAVGTVVILSDMSEILRHLRGTISIALLIMAGAFVVAYLLSSRLQQLISTPILSLVETMKEVSATKNFALRAIKPGSDEIGLLFDGFNEMLCEIEERNQILSQRQAHLQQLAHYDTLTRLPNRVLFYDRLTQALHYAQRTKEQLAVLFIDLDQFKDINDTLGHRTGDLLLMDVAKRLLTVVRDCDTVARLGGDEFTIFAQNVGSTENAFLVAQKIHELFKKPFLLEDKDIFVTASIGITMFPGDGETVDELLMNADIAMYFAKDSGKNSYQLFSKGMNKSTNERISLQTDLRLALERGEFFLHYQPKLDMLSGQVRSVEALIRWNHPVKGVLPPNKFIPLAEETGIIVELTDWVLRTACRQANAWQEAGFPRVSVAVNLSPYHFKRQDVVSTISRILTETGLNPELLEVEITESSLVQNNEYTLEALAELKRLGVTISIDDFGTGYSSLSYLHRFPIDTLKIDQSFIWNMTKSEGDRAIVTAIIAMAESLKMHVVAEGVETSAQLALLKEEGCKEIQGYLFSRPVNAEEVAHLFARENHFGKDEKFK